MDHGDRIYSSICIDLLQMFRRLAYASCCSVTILDIDIRATPRRGIAFGEGRAEKHMPSLSSASLCYGPLFYVYLAHQSPHNMQLCQFMTGGGAWRLKVIND